MTLRFCHWYPLDEAAAHAPASPGIYQLRIESGLIDYPRGKSAMVEYGSADDLRAAVTALAAQRRGESLLCRHAEEMSERERADPGAAVADLLARFERRFGAKPGRAEVSR